MKAVLERIRWAYNRVVLRDDDTNRLLGVALGGLLPIAAAIALVPLRETLRSSNLALTLVVAVVVAAAVGGRAAGAAAAFTSALSFDFFLTRPYLSLTIDSQDDVESMVLLLVVGLVVGTVAARARRATRRAEAGRDEIRRIHRVAEQVAGGEDAADVLLAVEIELTGLLDLRECRFEAVSRDPDAQPLPRLERNGIVGGQREHRLGRLGFELPHGGVDLPVYTRGRLVGRFVLVPEPGVGASLEQRVVAVALADQAGAVLEPVRAAPASGESGTIGHA